MIDESSLRMRLLGAHIGAKQASTEVKSGFESRAERHVTIVENRYFTAIAADGPGVEDGLR
jgi:hypothetical protein